MVQVTIIIPTRNRAPFLRKAIASFARQDFNRAGYEVIVVDNGSTDDTAEVAAAAAEAYPDLNLRCIYEPVPGLLSGRHRGAREAEGDLLAFVDDDIEAVPTWVDAVADAFGDTTVHLVGGPSQPRFETAPPAWMDRFIDRRTGMINCGDLSLFDIGDRNTRIDPTYVWGLNFSIRKQTLYDLGGFHPDCLPKELQHFQGDGETGLATKIRHAGLDAVYAGGARVTHYIPRERLTAAYFEDRYFYQGVCDSYTHIRQNRGVSGEPIEVQPVTLMANCDSSPYERYRHIVWARIRAAHQAGFRFHQDAVAAEPGLLGWVLREDYFDYTMPSLNGPPRPEIPLQLTAA